MQIEKYKYLNGNKYKIYMDKDEIILYEDIILKYNILSKREILKEDINKYLDENKYYEFYYKSLDYLKLRIRSKEEMEKYLKKNEVKSSDINKIIEKLEKDGYINDRAFCKSFINDQIYLKNDGPLKIINNLIKLGIDEKIIEEEIKMFDKEMQQEKIKKYIDKQVKLNKNKSMIILKNKILNNLLLMGYDKEDILFDLEDIKINEEEMYKREYDKLYKSLSKKYKGLDLERKIKQKLYQKGFYK